MTCRLFAYHNCVVAFCFLVGFGFWMPENSGIGLAQQPQQQISPVSYGEFRWNVQHISPNDAQWLLGNRLSVLGQLNLKISIDPATNSLVCHGDDFALQAVKKLMQDIDKPNKPDAGIASGAPNSPMPTGTRNFASGQSFPAAQPHNTPNIQNPQNFNQGFIQNAGFSQPLPPPPPPQSATPAPAITQPMTQAMIQPMTQQSGAAFPGNSSNGTPSNRLQLPAAPIPAPDPSVLAATEPNEAKSYYCKKSHFANITQLLQQRYGNNPRVDIDIRPENGLVLVWAPMSVQKEMEQLISQMDGFESFPQGQDPRELDGTVMRIVSAPKPAMTPNAPPTSLFHSPQFATLETIELKLQTVFGERMKQFPQSEDGRKKFRIAIPRPQGTYSCDLELNALDFRVKVTGSQEIVDQFMQLIGSIDQPSPKEGFERRYISIQNSDPEKIRKILETYRTKTAPSGSRKEHRNKIQQVVHLVQDGGTSSLGDSGGTSATGPSLGPSPGPDSGGYGAGMNFGFDANGQEIEVIQDHETKVRVLNTLDVVIIDAPMQEVSRIINMIKQLEKISEEAIPEIKIIFLEHVNCESLSGVLPPLSAQIINLKQGRVWVTPMRNPNAMLVYGWGAAWDSMIALIQNLDKPVDAENSLLRIVRLKSVSAQYLQGVIEDLFGIPTSGAMQPMGFAPRVRVMSDMRSNSLIIQAAQNDFREIERLISDLDINSSEMKLEIRTYKLKNVLAEHMVSMLQSALDPALAGTGDSKLPVMQLLTQSHGEKKYLNTGFLTDVHFTANAHNNTIVVTSSTENFELIEELITQLDVPSALAKLKVIQIQYSDAQTLRTTLETLLPTQMAGQGGPQLPGAEGEEAFVPVRIAIDQRSNSLLVVGSEGDINFIDALVMRLDQKDAMDRTLEVITLKNQSATDVANAINNYMRQYRDVQRESFVSDYQRLENEIVAVPEAVSNRLIINASRMYLEEIKELVKQLDKEPLQAVIQVMIGEVTLSDTDEFGIELGLQDPILFNRSILSDIQKGTKTTRTQDPAGNITTITEETILSADGDPGFNWNNSNLGNNVGTFSSAGTVAAQALSSFATGRVNTDAGFGGLVLAASSDAVSILLRAMQENSRLEVLSRPQVTAQDNQLALVFVGQEVSRVGGSSVSSGTVTASVDSKNVGLLLGVVPRIDPDGEKVVMLISAEKSSLGSVSDGVPIPSGAGETIRSPNINQIRTETIVSAKDGETVLLGGLITRDHQTLQRRVPYLSNVPVLGHLFRYDYERCKRTELIIVMKPRIIKNPRDMDEIKRVEMARMNWCLADVVKIHGNVEVYSTRQEIPVTGDAPVIEPGYVDPDELQLLDRPGAVNTPGSPPPPGRLPMPEIAPQNNLRTSPGIQETTFPQVEIRN